MNQDTVSGKIDQIKGKAKQSVGEAIGNDHLANSGVADQVKGAVQETWGHAKDAVNAVADDLSARTAERRAEAKEHASEHAHDIRENVSTSTEHARNVVSAKLDEVKDRHQRSA